MSCSILDNSNQIVCSYGNANTSQTVIINVSNSVPVNSITTSSITTQANVYTSTTNSYTTSVTQTTLDNDAYSYSFYFISPNVFAIPCTDSTNGQIYDCYNANTTTQTITLTSELVQPLFRIPSYVQNPNSNCEIYNLASCPQNSNTESTQYCNGVGSFCNQSNSNVVICNGAFANCNQMKSNVAICNGNYASCNQRKSNEANCNGNDAYCNQTDSTVANCNGNDAHCDQQVVYNSASCNGQNAYCITS